MFATQKTHSGLHGLFDDLVGKNSVAMGNLPVKLRTERQAQFGLFAGAQIGRTGLLFDPATQSPKVIAVWKEIAPLSLIVTTPAVVIGGWILFGIAYAVLYRFIAAAWPSARAAHVLRLATVIWLGAAFSELMGPLNLLHEPLALSSIEFTFWALAATSEALTIVLLSPRLG
jgi:hypothetical protein